MKRMPTQVMEVHPSLMTCHVTDGLTEDAVSARLHQGDHLFKSLAVLGCRLQHRAKQEASPLRVP